MLCADYTQWVRCTPYLTTRAEGAQKPTCPFSLMSSFPQRSMLWVAKAATAQLPFARLQLVAEARAGRRASRSAATAGHSALLKQLEPSPKEGCFSKGHHPDLFFASPCAMPTSCQEVKAGLCVPHPWYFFSLHMFKTTQVAHA